jgi:hypothetical protein
VAAAVRGSHNHELGVSGMGTAARTCSPSLSATRRQPLNTLTIPDDWIARLADSIAAAIQEIAPLLANESIALFAVDCHPWHGMVGLAILTSEELARNSLLAEPSEMAEWQHYDFACQLAAGKSFIPLGEEMRSAYYQAEDRPRMAEAFLKACAVAATTPQVTAALELLKREKNFRISVTHPDSNREFMVSE